MPISTDSDGWQKGEEIESIKTRALKFLEEEPDQAFSSLEICDAIMDTNWAELFDMIDEWDDDEMVRVGDIREKGGDWEDLWDSKEMMDIHLSELEADGEIECRYVSAEDVDLPVDLSELEYYTVRE